MKQMLKIWVVEALKDHGGRATVLEVSKHVWVNHREELEAGDLFYTWQYDVRWAAHALRKQGRIRAAKISPRGVWELAT
jgi:hypothetical protein